MRQETAGLQGQAVSAHEKFLLPKRIFQSQKATSRLRRIRAKRRITAE